MNAIGGLFGDLLQLGLPLNFYSDYVSRVSALTIPELEACAKTLLNPQEIVWMVVGDRAQLEAPLRALNIGEIIPAAA
jgi:zinc protease